MSTQVLIAHTGQRLPLDTSDFPSLDDFKAAVSRQISIPVLSLICLTPQGKPLKAQTFHLEKEVCIYDNRLAQSSSSPTSSLPKPSVPMPKRYSLSKPPNQILDTASLQSWQDLFKTRRDWALRVAEDCAHMANASHDRRSETDVMLCCLNAAVANLDSVVRVLEPKYTDLKKWAPGAQADYTALTTGWERYLSLARSIPAAQPMVRFMTGRDPAAAVKGRLQRQPTLEDLVDLDVARRTGRHAPVALRKFTSRVADLEKAASRLFPDTRDLVADFERVAARSAIAHDAETGQLLQDIEALANKIETDYQSIMDLTDSSRDLLAQASKIAAIHTERLLPSIRNRALEMDEMVRLATQARNDLAAESTVFMHGIADITALSQTVKAQIHAVGQNDDFDTFDYLRLIQQVPYLYASFVAEAVKRREWFDKVKQDSSTLANEMALFQDEEVKRRRKWQRNIGDTYGPDSRSDEHKVPGLEVNLLGEEEEPWPVMTQQDLDTFMGMLQKEQADPGLLNDVAKMVAEISGPTKQQVKRVRAFKNGSVHEAALVRSGLLVRGDDDLLRSLQDDKSKLESRLRTADSRIRRLEDLLHRQSQASRPSVGALFQLSSTSSQPPSDRNDYTISARSPRASTEDRRRSAFDGSEALLQRIQQLEAELGAEKARSAVFEKDLTTRTTLHDDIKGQMEEANSTKRDLLENMEALKREHVQERKSLLGEISKLQARLDDTEDEIEHFGESRENEKASYGERIQSLELELERTMKKNRDEVIKAEGQVDFLRKEARLQRERMESTEKQLQSAQDESKTLGRKLESISETAEAQLKGLRALWEQLSPQDAAPAPEDTADLVEDVVAKVTDALTRTRNAEGDVSLVKADLELAHRAARELRAEIADYKEKLAEAEIAATRLREGLAEEKAKATALDGELAEGRDQLSQLRVMIADGETGSESLRKRLEEEEEKITRMTEQLAARQSQVCSLEEEVRLVHERFHDTQRKLTDLTRRSDSRTERTKDLTQRLYSQNERLGRLLERLGFCVTRQGGSMTIQKVPRSERLPHSAQESDPSASLLRRSGTLQGRVLPENVDLDVLYWMNGTNGTDANAHDPCPAEPAQDVDEAEAERYAAFMDAMGSFDVDAFSDAIYKRVKDVEHMARKLQRDARAYREKAQALQKEAHDKIAFKNFKEGDLALFLPTRNQTTGAWAAFNVGFPHYFLREQEMHRLRSREWLVARISRIQERVVDLSRSLQHAQPPAAAPAPSSSSQTSEGSRVQATEPDAANEEENDNPFDLSDGLRWYLLDALEDKPGAPSTPGLAKSTVAANTVEAMADMHSHNRPGSKSGALTLVGSRSGIEGVSRTLSKSLESRRSSTGSKKALPFSIGGNGSNGARGRESALASETNSLRAVPASSPSAGVASSPPKPQSQRPPSTNGEAVQNTKQRSV